MDSQKKMTLLSLEGHSDKQTLSAVKSSAHHSASQQSKPAAQSLQLRRRKRRLKLVGW